MLSVLVLALLFLPATMPRANAPENQFNPSDPSLDPVERAEENFAGSAFYFIDPNYAIPQNYDGFDGGESDGRVAGVDAASGDEAASARPLANIAFRGSSSDNSRALQCLTLAIYYEAGMEPDAGQRGVAQVVLNRVRHPSYPRTVCGVVFQGSERRTGCQFSFTCDGSMRRKPSAFHWNRSKKVAAEALAGQSRAMVGTATHYHATYVYPYWAPSLQFLGTIGAHRFYAFKGKAGRASVFANRYAGGEPAARAHPRNYVSKLPSTELDPAALQRQYEREFTAAKAKAEAEAAAQQNARAQAADAARRHGRDAPDLSGIGYTAPRYATPQYSAEALQQGGDKAFAGQKMPDASQIKPEFRNSGTWKKKPGG